MIMVLKSVEILRLELGLNVVVTDEAKAQARRSARMNRQIGLLPVFRRAGLLARAWSHRSCLLRSRGNIISDKPPSDFPGFL